MADIGLTRNIINVPKGEAYTIYGVRLFGNKWTKGNGAIYIPELFEGEYWWYDFPSAQILKDGGTPSSVSELVVAAGDTDPSDSKDPTYQINLTADEMDADYIQVVVDHGHSADNIIEYIYISTGTISGGGDSSSSGNIGDLL